MKKFNQILLALLITTVGYTQVDAFFGRARRQARQEQAINFAPASDFQNEEGTLVGKYSAKKAIAVIKPKKAEGQEIDMKQVHTFNNVIAAGPAMRVNMTNKVTIGSYVDKKTQESMNLFGTEDAIPVLPSQKK